MLERIHTDFVRAGAKLQGEQRQRFAELQTQLAELQTSFRQNLLADEAEYALSVGDDQLDGLPGFALDGARAAAAERKLPGHVFTLSRASVLAFLGFSSQRGLREQLWRAWTSRGEHAERDNRPLARRILALRAELAGLLSYANFADYALANRMAGTPQAVEQLMRQVWEPASKAARASWSYCAPRRGGWESRRTSSPGIGITWRKRSDKASTRWMMPKPSPISAWTI